MSAKRPIKSAFSDGRPILGKVERSCGQCGGAFTNVSRKVKFCSVACGHIAASAGRKGKRNRPRLGSATPPKKPRRSAAEFECVQCGKVSLPSAWAKKFCSEDCRRKAFLERSKAKTAAGPVETVMCRECAKAFTAPMSRRRLFCSTTCADRASALTCRHRRRCQKSSHAAPAERVYRRAVFERDKWKCGLCGCQTVKSARHPHPKSPSLDHIVPLAAGGSHTYDNVQCACLSCNSRKQAGQGGQMILPGFGKPPSPARWRAKSQTALANPG